MTQYMNVSENYKVIKDVEDNDDRTYMDKSLYELYDSEHIKYPFFIAPKYDYYFTSEGYTTTYNSPIIKKSKTKKLFGCC
ncbi:hypothetical protein PRELSG_0116600 [Plasmodium relictum]|uniref:Uncharacterized protein n=1 Tax=Plasmodium relictum TaxID=85471 RepID=A0A1J1H506_PLARL|nr:hypothetical protein PRELSG_0116600 [Plasmodium relictum]CRG98515.1 hypothetical protein PRELSG_0116600 [Plasmodium relictum]